MNAVNVCGDLSDDTSSAGITLTTTPPAGRVTEPDVEAD